MDYVSPLISLITYRIGTLNNHDLELINFCTQIGLDSETTMLIYLADKKSDIEKLLFDKKYDIRSSLMRIVVLKKLSAEQKFRQNYGIATDEQMSVLLSKRSLFV